MNSDNFWKTISIIFILIALTIALGYWNVSDKTCIARNGTLIRGIPDYICISNEVILK